MSDLSIDSRLTMNDGRSIPCLGLGVFQMNDPDECEQAVTAALEHGYRHIDTAAIYGNEEAVGRAIASCGLPREEIFLTTKCWIQDFGRESTIKACEESLRKLATEYVDLYLLHWPVDETMMGAWEACQSLREQEKCRSIGVSNLTVRRMDEFFFKNTDVIPAVNQIELHPFCTRPDVRICCEKRDVLITSYSPLAQARYMDETLLSEIAAAHSKTVAQIMIRWNLQHGLVVIPKSVKETRICENAGVFDFALSDEEMTKIDGLNRDEFVIDWRPPQQEWY